MPQYKNFHIEKPAPNQLIYWMGPDMKDILGWFRGNLQFHEVERKFPGYIPKWWYPAESELNIPPLNPAEKESVRRSRKPKETQLILEEKKENPKIIDNSGEFF